MTVKHSLLAILAQNPCYGYQLRSEFERRTAATWPLNVGQIYNTLDRFERDGFVTRGESDEAGHVFWSITPQGRVLVDEWFAHASERNDPREEIATKVSLAISLPGISAGAIIAAEQVAAAERLLTLTARRDADPDPLSTLIRSAAVHRAQADIAWLNEAQKAVMSGTLDSPSAVISDPPKRGRPKKSAA